jgi:hypothetical protein
MFDPVSKELLSDIERYLIPEFWLSPHGEKLKRHALVEPTHCLLWVQDTAEQACNA